jgi:Mg-chelatase subunit ChlD
MASGLPDCEAVADLSVPLTDVERSELVRRIFEQGPGAIDKFVKEQSASDSSIARAVERFRAILEEQARRMRERADRERASRLEGERQAAEPEQMRLTDEEREAQERQRRLRDKLGEILEEGLLADPVIKMVVEASDPAASEKGAWARVRAFFSAISAALARFWNWLLSKLGMRKPATDPSKPGVSTALLIDLPHLGDLGGLEAKFEGVLLTSPELRKGFEASIAPRMGRLARLKFSLAKRLSPRSYGRMAREAFRRQLDRLLSRRKNEAADEQKELDKRIDEIRRMRGALEDSIRGKEKDMLSGRDRLLADMGRRIQTEPEQMARKKIEEDLARSGLICLDPATGRIEITARLVDRFAEIALSAELRNLPSKYTFALGRTAVQQGTYERDRMKTVDEVSRMDIVESLVTSRLSHPHHRALDDDDVRVNRELSGCSLHVVLVFDKSSSMEENNRIQAAKKAVLALFKAVKKRDRRNTVDLVGFDTDVRPMDLVSVWESKPGGFTNTGAALRTARELLQRSRSDQNLVYLITDGFPEAYTDKDGQSIAGDNERSLASAVAEAGELRRVRNVRLVHILLEPKERIFVDAAEKIVGAAHGKLITTDPNRLAAEMLTDYSAISAA